MFNEKRSRLNVFGLLKSKNKLKNDTDKKFLSRIEILM